MNIWIEKLRAAPTKIERDEILLRELRALRRPLSEGQMERIENEIEDQLRSLADLAFDSPTVL